MSPSLYPNGNTSVLHLFGIQIPSTEPEQKFLSSQSSMNLCESLSIRLFAVEQGLPWGNVPDWTGITNKPKPERYTDMTRIRERSDGSGEDIDDSGQSRETTKSRAG